MRDVAAARVAQMIDRTSDRGERRQILAFGRRAAAKPSGNSSLMKPVEMLARAPARMLHHRGEERHVVLDAVDIEGVERRRTAHRSRRRASARA